MTPTPISGRKGNWYEERAWADAVVEDTINGALKVITEKRPDLNDDLNKKNELAKQIAIGAIRYWLTKFSTETEIKFKLFDRLHGFTVIDPAADPYLVSQDDDMLGSVRQEFLE